jgi:hypothetical protein
MSVAFLRLCQVLKRSEQEIEDMIQQGRVPAIVFAIKCIYEAFITPPAKSKKVRVRHCC